MSNNYYSDSAPCFKKATIKLNSIPAYQYDSSVAAEYKAKKITKAEVLEIYESMLTIREFEEMILSAVPVLTKSSATTTTAARPTSPSVRKLPPPVFAVF